MELEIIDPAKDVKNLIANCCGADVWFVAIPQ